MIGTELSDTPSAESAKAYGAESFRELMDVLPDGILIRRGDTILYANQALAGMLGVEPPALVGKSPLDFLHVSDRARAGALLCKGLIQLEEPIELRAIRSDGGITVVQPSIAKRVTFQGGEAVLRVVRDVTERKSLMMQLAESERMASIGGVTAGVAHEINNPLTALMASVEMGLELVKRLPATAPPAIDLETELRGAREAACRVRDVVRDLRIFSRSEADERRPVDIHAVLDSALRLARTEIRHRARLVRSYGQVPLVAGSESRLVQVFLNLIVNAAQAIPAGAAESNQIRITTALDADGRVAVSVQDTGHGIQPEVMAHLFVPFFTTKPAHIGTGLGLATCRRILAGLGGEISAASQPGQGAIFRVLLLPSAAPSYVSSKPSARVPSSVLGGRILVIDDEELVGSALRRYLAPDHEVVVETRALDALERIRAGRRFDLILCDLMIPVTSGWEFYELLAEEFPEQAERTVFLTGGAFTPEGQAFLARVSNVRIEKPFELRTLQALLDDWLGNT
jgi:PAS domain S-box-containing protein